MSDKDKIPTFEDVVSDTDQQQEESVPSFDEVVKKKDQAEGPSITPPQGPSVDGSQEPSVQSQGPTITPPEKDEEKPQGPDVSQSQEKVSDYTSELYKSLKDSNITIGDGTVVDLEKALYNPETREQLYEGLKSNPETASLVPNDYTQFKKDISDITSKTWVDAFKDMSKPEAEYMLKSYKQNLYESVKEKGITIGDGSYASFNAALKDETTRKDLYESLDNTAEFKEDIPDDYESFSKILNKGKDPNFWSTYVGDAIELFGGESASITTNIASGKLREFSSETINLPHMAIRTGYEKLGLNKKQAENASRATMAFIRPTSQWTHVRNYLTDELRETETFKNLEKGIDDVKERGRRYDNMAIDYFKEGDWKKGAGSIGLSISESAPAMVLTLFGGQAGMSIAAAHTGSEKYDQLSEENPDMPEILKAVNSGATAGWEYLFEKIGTGQVSKLLKSQAKNAAKEVGEEVVKKQVKSNSLKALEQTLKPIYKKAGIWIQPVQEGLTEGMTSVAEVMTDYITTDKYGSWEEAATAAKKQFLESGIVGGVMGGGTTVGGSIGKITNKSKGGKDTEIVEITKPEPPKEVTKETPLTDDEISYLDKQGEKLTQEQKDALPDDVTDREVYDEVNRLVDNIETTTETTTNEDGKTVTQETTQETTQEDALQPTQETLTNETTETTPVEETIEKQPEMNPDEVVDETMDEEDIDDDFNRSWAAESEGGSYTLTGDIISTPVQKRIDNFKDTISKLKNKPKEIASTIKEFMKTNDGVLKGSGISNTLIKRLATATTQNQANKAMQDITNFLNEPNKNLNVAKASLETFIKTNKDSIEKLSPKLYSSILKRVGNIKNQKQVEQVANYINDLAIKSDFKREVIERGKLDKDINEKIDSIEKVESGRLKGKVDPKTYDKLKEIKGKKKNKEGIFDNVLEGSVEQGRERKIEILDELTNREDLTKEEFDELVDKYEIEQLRGINNTTETMTMEELRQAKEVVDRIVNEGKTEFRKQLEQERLERQNKKDRLNEILDKVELKKNKNKKVKESKPITEGIKTEKSEPKKSKYGFLDFPSMKSLGSLFDMIDVAYDATSRVFQGILNNTFLKPIKMANNKYSRGVKEMQKYVSEKILTTLGKSKDGKKTSKKMARRKIIEGSIQNDITYVDENGKEKTIKDMSQSQAAFLYNQMKDPALKKTFATSEMGYMKQDKNGDYTLTKKGEALMEYVPSEWKELADWLIDDFYPKAYDKYNEAYRKVYKADLPKNEFYAGILIREGDSTVKDGNVLSAEERLSGSSWIATAANGSQKQRQNSTKEIRAQDIIGNLYTYIDIMEYFNAYHEVVKDLNVWKDKDVREKFEKNFGKKNYKDLMYHIDKFDRRTEAQRKKFQIDKGLDAFRRGLTKASLALKPVIFVKQLTSIIATAPLMPEGYSWTRYFSNIVHHPKRTIKKLKELYKESDFLQARMDKGFERDISDAFAGRGGNREKARVATDQNITFTKVIMILGTAGDMGGALLAGLPIYEAVYKKTLKENGGNVQAAKDKAMFEFEYAISQTQQSGLGEDLGRLQDSSSIMKLFTMYMTSQNQYHRMANAGVRRMMQGTKDRSMKAFKHGVKTLVLSHVFLPMIFKFVSNFFRFDGEDELDAALLGNISSIPVIGPVIQSAYDNLYRGKPWDFSPSQGLSIINDAINDAEKIANDGIDTDDIGAIVSYLVEYGGAATGAPSQAAAGIAEGITDIIDKDKKSGDRPLEGVWNISGWSDYALYGPTEAQEKASESRRAKIKDNKSSKSGGLGGGSLKGGSFKPSSFSN